MKKSSLLIVILSLITALALSLTSCGEPPVEPTLPEALGIPSVSVSEDGVASWDSVTNAIAYAYKINGGSEEKTFETSLQLSYGQSITVKAIGDGTYYLDSEYSDAKTYTAPVQPPAPVTLAAPAVTVDSEGVASWQAVANAAGYVYKINGGAEVTTTSTSVQLSDGDSIVVKAKGDGTAYLDSAYSTAVTYTAPTPPPDPETLNVPTVTVNEDGLASWSEVANATGYKYIINGTAEQTTTSTSVQLTDGDRITVKALGDGTAYLDSAYSTSVTYTAPIIPETLSTPTVIVAGRGVASWEAVANAVGYVYKINGGAEQTTTSTTLQLTDGDSVTVKAIGDGVYYLDSAYSSAVGYEIVRGAIPEFDINSIPKYTEGGEGYYIVNGGVPFFKDNEITDVAYEFYGELDALGRCTVAMGCLDFSLMPTDSRGSLSHNPTGWQGNTMVNGDYVYNRSHLIGWQLTDEDNNANNLITGTSTMNQIVMLKFENLVASYIKETRVGNVSNHVMYRVTPIFEGNNLVCTGVLMEAYSVEDDGEELCFNVFCYNVEDGVIIDYATGQVTVEAQQPPIPDDATYIINTSSKIIHSLNSKYANNLSKNMEYTNLTLAELQAMGYRACTQSECRDITN